MIKTLLFTYEEDIAKQNIVHEFEVQYDDRVYTPEGYSTQVISIKENDKEVEHTYDLLNAINKFLSENCENEYSDFSGEAIGSGY